MIISSIYEHMVQATKDTSINENIKIVLRHSIRHQITSEKLQLSVELTSEGKAFAFHFGKNIKKNIGFLGSSDAKRCIQTLEYISIGAEIEINIEILNEQLRDPHVLVGESCGKTFNEISSYQIIDNLKNNIEVMGLRSLKESVKIILDGIFQKGNKANFLDLYCTHDFQVAMLASDLFDFTFSKDDFCLTTWPMMLEGIVIIGNRNRFKAYWRNITKIFENYLI